MPHLTFFEECPLIWVSPVFPGGGVKVMHFLQEYQRCVLVNVSSQGHMTRVRLIAGGVHFDHLVNVVTARFSPL